MDGTNGIGPGAPPVRVLYTAIVFLSDSGVNAFLLRGRISPRILPPEGGEIYDTGGFHRLLSPVR